MFLTSPLIEQAITLTTRSISVIAMFRQPSFPPDYHGATESLLITTGTMGVGKTSVSLGSLSAII